MRLRKTYVSDLLKAQSLSIITLPVYIRALTDTILNRKATFETIHKIGEFYEIPFDLLKSQIVIIVLNWSAVLYGLYSYPEASNKPALATNIFWALFHFLFMLYFMTSLYGNKRKSHR
jgi:hypothetical protein